MGYILNCSAFFLFAANNLFMQQTKGKEIIAKPTKCF